MKHNRGSVSTPLTDILSMWPLVLVGAIMAGMEIPMMMIYKWGGLISISQTLVSAFADIIIFTIGIAFFKEQLNAG